MRVENLGEFPITISEIFNPILIKTSAGEELNICMRDSGFEFAYGGKNYSAQEGVIKEMVCSNSNIGYSLYKDNVAVNVRTVCKDLGETDALGESVH